jgi:uncharacterized membrane protein
MRIFKYVAMVLVALLVIFFAIGLFNPEVKYSNKIVINASPAKSYSVFMDTTRMKEWMPGYSSFTLLEGKAMEKGSKWKLVLLQDGQEYEMNETITTLIPDVQYSFDLENAVLRNSIDMYFIAKAGQTELVSNNKVRGNNIMWRSLFILFKPKLHEQSQLMYEELKKTIEKPSK